MRTLLYILLFPGFLWAQGSLDKEIAGLESKIEQLKAQEEAYFAQLEDLKLQKIRSDIREIALPRQKNQEEIIFHSAYALAYSEAHEQARWVVHMILPDVQFGSFGRSNDFRPDPLVKSGSTVEKDYFLKTLLDDSTYEYDGFGYDRGHLAPSADFRWSKKALSESYFYSNMAPQVAELNREAWAQLESDIRAYVIEKQHPVFVISGGVLHDNLPKIERSINQVSIPEFFYKIVYDPQDKEAIAFLMPNKKCEYPVMYYACPIDKVEALSGIDFFPNLDDPLETSIEKTFHKDHWLIESREGEASPIPAVSLPRDHFNTVQAAMYIDSGEQISVCGKVVSTKLSAKGNVFINLDQKFPKQIFTISIFKDKLANFSYPAHESLLGKTICVSGKVGSFNGTPSMVIENEKAIEIWEND
ncbi:MAG: DNA/RNA non-specific endonuclease [Bacteroidota bacterium]